MCLPFFEDGHQRDEQAQDAIENAPSLSPCRVGTVPMARRHPVTKMRTDRLAEGARSSMSIGGASLSSRVGPGVSAAEHYLAPDRCRDSVSRDARWPVRAGCVADCRFVLCRDGRCASASSGRCSHAASSADSRLPACAPPGPGRTRDLSSLQRMARRARSLRPDGRRVAHDAFGDRAAGPCRVRLCV